MKLKLDENVPRTAAEHLAAAGHDVSTVVDENLVGAPDAVVVGAAVAEGRLLVTLDRGLADVRSRPPGTHPGIVVLRLRDQSAPNATNALRRLDREGGLEAAAGCVVVVGEGPTIRVRGPSPSDP